MYSSGSLCSSVCAEAAGRLKICDQRLDHEDHRQHRHRRDDRAVVPVLAELLAEDRADPGPAHAAPPLELDVLVDQLEVDVLERVARLGDREHVGAGLDQRPGDRRARPRPGPRRRRRTRRPRSRCQPSTAGAPPNTAVGILERRARPDHERLREQPLAELLGTSDHPQGRVQDRDPVAQPLGLLEPVGGEEDRHAALAQLARSARARRARRPGRGPTSARRGTAPRGRRAAPAPARPAGAAPLTARRTGLPARSVRLTASQRAVDPLGRSGDPVQPGEALEVLGHAQPQVQPGRLGHHGDPLADLDAVLRVRAARRRRRRTRGRRDQRAERPHGRRLAGAVRPEEAEHLALAHLERDVTGTRRGRRTAWSDARRTARARAAVREPTMSSDPLTSPRDCDSPGRGSIPRGARAAYRAARTPTRSAGTDTGYGGTARGRAGRSPHPRSRPATAPSVRS